MAESRRANRGRVDLPKTPRRGPALPDYDPESFGKFSERFARYMGTARFIAAMTVFIIVWVVWNTWAPGHLRFDPSSGKYIGLTLILSLQASYAAPLILLAQNRQADRDRVSLDEDRGRNDRSIADTEYLTREVASLRIAMGEVATRDFIRGELQRILEELEDKRVEAEPETA